jgi:hypothetical protein
MDSDGVRWQRWNQREQRGTAAGATAVVDCRRVHCLNDCDEHAVVWCLTRVFGEVWSIETGGQRDRIGSGALLLAALMRVFLCGKLCESVGPVEAGDCSATKKKVER